MQKFRTGEITGVWDETGIWRLCGTYVCRFSGSGRHDPQFVREWEKGTKIVIGVKSASKERRGMYLVRECYYRLINKITDIDHIDQLPALVCMTENLWMLCVICMIRCRIFEALLLSLDLIIKRLNIHSQSGVQEKAKIISTVFMIMQ